MDGWSDPMAVWDGRPTDDEFDPPIPAGYDGRDGSLEISVEEEEAMMAVATCPTPGCTLGDDDRAHARKYDEIERTEGREAADRWIAREEAFLTCDDCGRTDGTHDPDVEH